MSRYTSAAAAALVLLGSSAVAPASAEAFNGFFAGVQIGDTFGEASQPRSSSNGGALTVAQSDYKLGALQIGPHVGFNLPIEQFVVGVVGDYNFIDVNEDDGGSAGDINSLKLDSIATLRARAGWLFLPHSLLYVTGGAAWMQGGLAIDRSVGTTSTAEKHDIDFSGYTYGLGTEFAIGEEATFGVEWRRYEFDSELVSFTALYNGYDIGVDPDLDTIQVSLSYYFSDMLF